MRSSTTPPFSSQHRVYCALPSWIRPRSLVRQELTKSRAPGPETRALPRCDTSKIPTDDRTAVCSRTTPPPGYSIGISQPPKSAILAPSATCRSCRGEVFRAASLMGRTLPPRAADPRRHGYPAQAGPNPHHTKDANVTTVNVSDRSAHDLKADVVVLGTVDDSGSAALAAGHGLPRDAAAHVAAQLAALHATGKPEEVLTLAAVPSVAAPRVVLTGLGSATARATSFDAEVLRRAAGAAVRSLKKAGKV